MDTLALFTKNIVSERIYESVQTGQKFSSTITDLDVVRRAISTFKEGMIGKVNENGNTEDNLRRLFENLNSRSN